MQSKPTSASSMIYTSIMDDKSSINNCPMKFYLHIKKNFVFMSKKFVIYCKFLSNLIDREFPRSALVLGTQCYSAQASWSQC